MRNVLLLCIMIALAGCARAGASGGATARQIPSPDGVDCYAIMDSQGSAVGGNCIRQ